MYIPPEEFMSLFIFLFDHEDDDTLQLSSFLITRAHSKGIWESCGNLWFGQFMLLGDLFADTNN